MVGITDIIYYISISISFISIILAFIYSISIFSIRRFQNSHNIFTVNLCLTTICCNIYWNIRYIVFKLYPYYLLPEIVCSILTYGEMMCTFQVPLAFVLVAVNRLCSIVYHTEIFFKTKNWIIICTTIQWISGMILSIPRISFYGRVRY